MDAAGNSLAGARAITFTVSDPVGIEAISPENGEELVSLTRETVGHKLAIVLDGVVRSAPIVQSAVTGGRLTITLGGADADDAERDARELVKVLRTGALPAPLVEESVQELGPAAGSGR